MSKDNVSYDYLEAKYYDKICDFMEYDKKTKTLKGLIKKYFKRRRVELLEVGCGTGNFIKYMRKSYHCTGLDNSPAMLKIAKKKFKDINFYEADMIHFELEKQFDVVVNLFGSIAYVKTAANLAKTFISMYDHLKPGGLLIVDPFCSPKEYVVGSMEMETYSDKKINIATINVFKKRGDIAINQIHYMIAEKDKKVQCFVRNHELGLFEVKDVIKIMKSVGFKAKYLKKGLMKDRGVFIGLKE